MQVNGRLSNNMATITIRNKKTGETKTIPQEQLMQFGVNMPQQTQLGGQAPQGENTAVQAIQARLQELGQPQQEEQQPQGDFMTRLLQSRTLPIAGSVVGGGVGSLAGPVTGIAGAGAGYAGGDVVRKELSNLLGVEGKQAERTPETIAETAKGAGTAAAAQGIGETAGFALKFIKPGTVTSFLGKATDYFSKKGTFGKIPKEVLETRFMDEVIPRALRWSEGQGEDVVQAGKKLIESKLEADKAKVPSSVLEKTQKLFPKSSKTAEEIGTTKTVFDAEELNFLRKNLNAIGEGADGMKKALVDGLAKIVREEQLKRAPGAAVTLPADKAIREGMNALRSFWPTRMLLMLSDLARSAGSGIGSTVSKFGGAPLVGGMLRKQE